MTAVGFLTPLVYEHIGGRMRRLREPLIYQGYDDQGNPLDRFEVPAGFESDLASIPRLFWNIFPPDDDNYVRAAWVHDYNCKYQQISRLDADRLFRKMMRVEGAGWCKRQTIYCMVRAFGWYAWHQRAKELAQADAPPPQ